jgi:hypothetical protein
LFFEDSHVFFILFVLFLWFFRKMIFRLKSARNTARERIFVKNTQKRGKKEGGAQKKCPTAPFGPTSAPAAPLKIKSVTNVRAQHRARAFL